MPLFINHSLRRALRHVEIAAQDAGSDYTETLDLARSGLNDEQAFADLSEKVKAQHGDSLRAYLKTDAAQASKHPILDYLIQLIPTILAILASIFHFPVPPIPPLPPVP